MRETTPRHGLEYILLLILSCAKTTHAKMNCSSGKTPEELAYCLCPFQDDDPCQCTILDDSKYTVACYQAHGLQLQEMMDKVRSAAITVRTLFVNGCNVTLPHSDAFRSLTFDMVHFVRSRVDPPAERSPESFQAILGGLENSVSQVHFRDTLVPGLDSTSCALGALTQLRRLSITGAGLKSIPDDFFCCSYLNLEDVYLFGNAIEAMRRGGLSRAEGIQTFNANSNRISVVDRHFFHDPAPKLREIRLRHNQIQTIPRDMFSGMPSLKLVDLAYNKITLLPANTWASLWNTLPDVYLEGNQLTCGCSLDWLARTEHQLSDKQRWSRFLTGSCLSHGENTSALENFDFTEMVCS